MVWTPFEGNLGGFGGNERGDVAKDGQTTACEIPCSHFVNALLYKVKTIDDDALSPQTNLENTVAMTYDARQIANWFITRAKQDERTLSIMSLLKLTYIAHGWHLETQGAPLIENKIEAWQYGPVIPDVYKEFRKQGIAVEQVTANFVSKPLDVNDETLLQQIWSIYGHLSPFQLSDITHVPSGPWDLATQAGGNYAIIPDDLIVQHYRELRRTRTIQQAQNA